MIWIWITFVLFVLLMLALDLGVFHRKAQVVSLREALIWSAVWVTMALAFGAVVYLGYEHHWHGLGLVPDAVDGVINDGTTALTKYLTGYIVEKSLSIDNIFVIAVIFGFFAVPPIYQHRVLFWGILGALAMRGVMIAVGSALISRFTWILYVFGALLIVTAIKMLVMKTHHGDPGKNPIVRLVRRLFPVTDQFHGEQFFIRAGDSGSQAASPLENSAAGEDAAVNRARPGTFMLTPLALALILVEATDLIFAVDSIPAIFAITSDPFLVFTSNIFAILGLRSLYFALAGMIDKFRYLKLSLAIVLAVVGTKMLAHSWIKAYLGTNANFYLLALILGILATGIVASLLVPRRNTTVPVPPG